MKGGIYMEKRYHDQDFDLSENDAALADEIKKESTEIQGINLYRDILWIDDRSGHDAENNALKWMRRYCKKEIICAQIDQVDSFFDAVDKIVQNSTQYDLVIFDINLENCFDGVVIDQAKRDRIEKVFRDYHIGLKEGGAVTFEELGKRKKIAGYYLFRLLLSVGYPLSRMLIFSANSELNASENTHILHPSSASDDTNAEAQRELDLIIDDRIRISKSDHPEKLQPEIERRFSGKNSYYQIRRMIFQAGAYWEAKLNSLDFKDISFNKLYSLEIEKQSFLGILDHVKMMFPVKQPSNPKSVYFRAMQIIASFHEESADIFNKNLLISNYPKLRKYHLCIRYFRNWSAHNKTKSELDGDKFALLFCIAMRTYFTWESDKDLQNDLLPYETIYGFNKSCSVDRNGLRRTLYNAWIEIHEKINSGDTKEKYKGFYRDLSKAIHNLGYVKGISNMERYLFLPIWCVIPFEATPDKSDNEAFVSFTVKQREIDDLIKASKTKCADGIFMSFCYQWLCFD